MIRSIFNLFWKPKKIDLIKFHVLDNQYRGVIGWSENSEETIYPATGVYTTPVRGELEQTRRNKMTLNTTTRKMAMQSQTHVPQQITINTRKLLDKVIKKTKLSRPKQLELLVEEYYKNLIPNQKKT